MTHRYEEVYAQLLENVPELGLTYGPDYERRDWEWAMERTGQPLSEEDRAYLLSVEVQNAPPPKAEQPLLYTLFESYLLDVIVAYTQQRGESARLADIMGWLEELARDGDERTQNLVAIGICEDLITNRRAHFALIFPFLGDTMRQMCRDLFPLFQVDEEIKALLAPTKNTRRFAKRP